MQNAANHATLTVYTDASSGTRIALAVKRAGPSSVPWSRLDGASLDQAVDGALRAAEQWPAFAVVVPGHDGSDTLRALTRCLRRAEMEGFVPGRELTAPPSVPVE